MRCECGFIVIGDFTIIKVHLFRPVYVLIVYYYSTCNNNNNSAFILKKKNNNNNNWAVTIIQKQGPALRLWINPAKCALFSHTVLSDFPQEMKVSHEPNFEVLAAITGDPIFCAKFLAQRRAKAAKLLSQLVTVGSLDPQVALLLLHRTVN